MSGLHMTGISVISHLSPLRAALTHPLLSVSSPFCSFWVAGLLYQFGYICPFAFLRHLEFLQSLSPVLGLGTQTMKLDFCP